ncbi:MAG: glycosyltransferase [Planctomycetota bacterium]
MTAPDDIRVVLQQPALPAYRVPVFAELARRPGLQLQVVHGELPRLPTAPARGFEAMLVPARRLPLPVRPITWHQPQLTFADRRHTDVLVMSWNVNCASLVPALLRARRQGVGTVLWGHGYSKSETTWRRRTRMQVARLATALLLYDHATARRIVEEGEDPRRVFVALNTRDLTPVVAARERWSATPARLEAFRHAQAIEDGPVVLFVSRLDSTNRLDLLLQAAQRLSGSHPGLTVLVVGKGPTREPLEEMATSLGIADRVRFLGPIYDELQLAPWFLSADVFCYPNNVGLSLIHAFAYGLPVVTTDRVAGPEIEALEDGVNGLLYEHGDAGSLATAIGRIIDDPVLAETMSAAARRTVHERFTVENMVDGMEAAIRFAAAEAGALPCTSATSAG